MKRDAGASGARDGARSLPLIPRTRESGSLEVSGSVKRTGSPLSAFAEASAVGTRAAIRRRASTRWRLAANPDVAAAHVNPLDHFLQHGATRAGRPSMTGCGARWVHTSRREEKIWTWRGSQ